MTGPDGLGLPGAPEHQSRLLGMGLLLGKISFRSLEAAYRTSREGGSSPDLGTLIRSLMARGELPSEVLERLENQVADLERLLVERRGGGNDLATVEMARAGDGAETAPRAPDSLLETPPRSLEAPESDAEGQALLSVLTLPRWNQYINLQFISEGGMGRIFRAFDPTLNRVVALKFLRWVGTDSVQGLINEARHQAQVDHPNICKVYEVREWHGQVYVAMQFIDGQTLDRVGPELGVLQKVELMETVAEAAHAAHRHGLVHRDLKPTNIMVETTADGALKPYILDFGLARDLTATHETLQGSIVGTVHYMAPEQARGDTEAIERRTDVYALGVTLYELLAGAPPFQGYVGMDCLRRICEADVPPLREVVPDIHRDLETIVMKCLEREIGQRYESARALAEDLRRFRDEEPIHARAATFLYRMGKFARKNKTLVALASVALAAVLLFAGLGLHARLTASSQAYWAQHFGQEAERIEALLRYARLQPTHDIGAELEAVRERIRAMEAEVERAGARARGPGRYAIGRAHLALGEAERASTDLDLAWNAGFRVLDVAYARGRALGQRYAQGLRQARMIGDPQLRQARMQELEETLRAPARDLLLQGRGSLLEPAGFNEGLLALYDRRYAQALESARGAARSAPWFYEARVLEAEVHLERSRREADPGQALAFLAEAGGALEAAARIAPSDPGLCDLLSRRWWEEMVLLRRTGRDPQPAHAAFTQTCGRWMAVLPGVPGAPARLAWGDLERARTAEPARREALIREAIEGARRVLAAHPSSQEALGCLAAGLTAQAYADLDAGHDPRPVLDQAIDLLRRALENPATAFELFEPYAATFWARIEYEKYRGMDPAGTVQVAISSVQSLAGRFPRIPDFDGFIGGVLGELADFQASHGTDPGPVVERALVHLRRACLMAPGRFEFHFTLGTTLLARAQYRVLGSLPAEEDLDAAERAYQAALGCNAVATGPRFGLGEVGLLRAQILERDNRSPLTVLQRAEAVMDEEVVRSERNWRTHLFHAQAALARVRWTTGDEARRHLERASREAGEAVRLSGRLPYALLVQAQVLEAQGPRLREAAGIILQEALEKDPAYEPVRRLVAARGKARRD